MQIPSGAPRTRGRVPACTGASRSRPGLRAALFLGAAFGLGGVLAGAAPGSGPSDEVPELDWRMLLGLNYETGEMTDTLTKLNGKTVKMPGFMVPLEDFAETVSEFLLVPYYGACVHVPPPPPNQLVYIEMAEDKAVKVEWWDPIWVEGTFEVEKIESIYGIAGFHMKGMKITPYDPGGSSP